MCLSCHYVWFFFLFRNILELNWSISSHFVFTFITSSFIWMLCSIAVPLGCYIVLCDNKNKNFCQLQTIPNPILCKRRNEIRLIRVLKSLFLFGSTCWHILLVLFISLSHSLNIVSFVGNGFAHHGIEVKTFLRFSFSFIERVWINFVWNGLFKTFDYDINYTLQRD